MVFKDLSPKLIELLADVVGLGAELAAYDEVIALVRALRHLRPVAWELSLVEAWALMSSHDMMAARRLLEELERVHPDHALIKGMLSLCLKFQRDDVWQAYAAQVRNMPASEDAMPYINLAELIDGLTNRKVPVAA